MKKAEWPQVGIRLAPEQRAALRELAEASGMTESAIVRRALDVYRAAIGALPQQRTITT